MKHLATACWVNKGLFNVAEFCWNLKQKPVTLPSNPKWPGQSSIDHFLICTLGKCPQFALDLLHSEVHCIPPVRGKPETSLLKNWLSTSSRIVSWVSWRILEVPQVTGVPPVIIHFLTGAKRREWMGCWGLLGVAGMIIHSQWIIPENSLLTKHQKVLMRFSVKPSVFGVRVPTWLRKKHHESWPLEVPAGATQQESIGKPNFRHGVEPIW